MTQQTSLYQKIKPTLEESKKYDLEQKCEYARQLVRDFFSGTEREGSYKNIIWIDLNTYTTESAKPVKLSLGLSKKPYGVRLEQLSSHGNLHYLYQNEKVEPCDEISKAFLHQYVLCSLTSIDESTIDDTVLGCKAGKFDDQEIVSALETALKEKPEYALKFEEAFQKYYR